jgi:CHAT domain-containing protein
VLTRTVSSYIPTLTSLRRARGFTPAEQARQLTVAVKDRAGSPPLPDVTTELDRLTRHFPPGPANHQLVASLATRDEVVAAMATHDWIHLACHAGPLDTGGGSVNRGFALWDGDLTITDLAAQPGREGGLAFLSACQTATGSDEHRDEALHLAAAMQFLGYRHVIATMWSIADTPAPLVTDLFYTALSEREEGAARDGEDGAAGALRQAIIQLRDADPTNPFAWAAYVHIGY